MSDIALKLTNVRRSFKQGREELEVLRGVDLAIHPGEIVALVGPSGTGKSTLLQISGLLEKPSSGEVLIAGTSAGTLSDDKRTALRRLHLGFVYQYHHLLPEFSALENVVLPQMIAGVSKSKAAKRAQHLLEGMGLADRIKHRPAELSGGEQQRVAICRALANGPRLLLADEPTGNLDPHTSDHVFAAFLRLVRDEGLAALIATHNPDLAARMDRTVSLSEGRLREGVPAE
jgi:lipoprotein-releasing system ATP-binding protein